MNLELKVRELLSFKKEDKILERLGLRGYVEAYTLDKHGNVRVYRRSNTVTNGLKRMFHEFMLSTPQNPVNQNVNYIAVGIGSSLPSPDDAQLQDEISRKVINSRIQNDEMVKFAVQFEMSEQNPPLGQALTEAGLFQNATSDPNTGVLVARSLFQPAILKQNDEMLVVVWTLTLSS